MHKHDPQRGSHQKRLYFHHSIERNSDHQHFQRHWVLNNFPFIPYKGTTKRKLKLFRRRCIVWFSCSLHLFKISFSLEWHFTLDFMVIVFIGSFIVLTSVQLSSSSWCASQRESITLHYHSLRYGASPVCIHHSLPHTLTQVRVRGEWNGS